MLSILSVALALMGILIITLGALLGSSKKQYVTLEPTTSTASKYALAFIEYSMAKEYTYHR